jgi:pyruvate dehydrogenase E1 component
MAFVRLLTALVRDKELGKRVVPIVPDEARTFGMEGMFRQLGIFAPEGPEVRTGRQGPGDVLPRGQGGPDPGGGHQRGGCDVLMDRGRDLVQPFEPGHDPVLHLLFHVRHAEDRRPAWAAADQRARGFLLGATAGRTTLNGEGLQHEDGHSHIFSSVIPNCISYDPTFGYELAVIIHDGLRRMVSNQEDVFYYITLMNENYEHPALPEGPSRESSRASMRSGSRTRRRNRACRCSVPEPSCAK